MNEARPAVWAGIIGPPLFVAVFTIEGRLRPGYSALGDFVSELSLGSRGWIQITNFIVLGVSFLVFARCVAGEFADGKASRAGPIILAVIGVGLLGAGPFVMDPASTPRGQLSWTGTIHQLLGALVLSLSPISCFVFLRRFWSDQHWRSFGWWTLAVGVITAAAVVMLRFGPALPPDPPNVFNPWVGLIQRTIIVPYLLWVFTFAVAIFRGPRPGSRG